jgi:hypothetical protein
MSAASRLWWMRPSADAHAVARAVRHLERPIGEDELETALATLPAEMRARMGGPSTATSILDSLNRAD